MIEDEWLERIKAQMSEHRFKHTLGVAEMAVTLSRCHGVDPVLARKAALLHDIAKKLSFEEMVAVSEAYGHKPSDFSFRYRENMHAEVGALIAEHEFGLSDKDALDAIRFHVSARPDMSILEKIIFFSDRTEPSRPNSPLMRSFYEIAKTDLDLAILRMLPVVIDYQVSHDMSADICKICTEAYDFLLDEKHRKDLACGSHKSNNDLLSDEEFDEARALMRCNRIKLKSVENIRWLKGFIADDGRKVKDGLLIRSGDLSHLTAADADRLKLSYGLSLVIDLRTPSETEKASDEVIAGVRYERIP